MSAAADAEDKTEKHPVTPGVPRPARELYGVMLLESGNAKGPLIIYRIGFFAVGKIPPVTRSL
jgi:hypothetical protein